MVLYGVLAVLSFTWCVCIILWTDITGPVIDRILISLRVADVGRVSGASLWLNVHVIRVPVFWILCNLGSDRPL